MVRTTGIFALVMVIGLSSLSQLLFKSLFQQRTLAWNWGVFTPIFFDPRLAAGILAQLGATAFWWWLLSRHQLSILFPAMIGGMFITIPMASSYLYGESLGRTKLLAVALIWIGILVLSRADH